MIYECQDCGFVFESDIKTEEELENLTCPNCHGGDVITYEADTIACLEEEE